MSTNTRETNADILRNPIPVGGRTQILLVEFKNGQVVRFAEAGRTSGDNLQHGLEWSAKCNDLKDLRCGRLFRVFALRLRAVAVREMGLRGQVARQQFHAVHVADGVIRAVSAMSATGPVSGRLRT